MRIFTDYHHSSLYYSLKLLADRLGAKIWRPIGESWFNEGYWKIAEPYGNHPDTIKQYLSTDPLTEVPFFCNPGAEAYELRGQYVVGDPAHHSQDFAMTLELFKELKFDVIIVTYPQHLESWLKLRDAYQPQAKVVFQVGNNGWSRYFQFCPNVLSSARHSQMDPFQLLKLNYVEYHQEFPLDVFKPLDDRSRLDSLQAHSVVTSFVNLLPSPELFKNLSLETAPELQWYAHGHSTFHGVITGIKDIARIMRHSRFGYHYKPGGDGYGHILHNWFACGIPVIGDWRFYANTLGEDLFDSDTCIPLDAETILQIQRNEEYYNEVRKRVIGRFHRVVNFDDEFESKLKPFFERLV